MTDPFNDPLGRKVGPGDGSSAPQDDAEDEDEYLAAHILARAAKAVSHAQPSKRREFEISAGYLLNEARTRAGGGWAAWCAKYLIKLPLHRVDLLLAPYNAPPKVEPPAWDTPIKPRVASLWSAARPILQEYYCEGGGCNPAGQWDREQSEVWFKWFDPYNRGIDIPAAQWAAFLAEVAPVYARCARDLRELQKQARARWNIEKAKQRAREQAAVAFIHNHGKTEEENQRLWIESGWAPVRKKTSVWRDIIVGGESWRVMVYQGGNVWKIRLTPPGKSRFSVAYSPVGYPTADAAKSDARNFIKHVFNKGSNR
jgi:hypothetical protein